LPADFAEPKRRVLTPGSTHVDGMDDQPASEGDRAASASSHPNAGGPPSKAMLHLQAAALASVIPQQHRPVSGVADVVFHPRVFAEQLVYQVCFPVSWSR
jgi:hypothetical protein